MPLGGSGGVLGDLLASAVGAPPAAGSFFGKLGGVIASWAPANIQVKPVSMVAAQGAVAGTGKFQIDGTKEDLGNKLADALDIPADAVAARATWIATADAIIKHLVDFGVPNGTGLTSGAPCGGQGTVAFTSPLFVPPLASAIAVADAFAAGLLEAFAAGLINHIAANAKVVAISLSGLPLTAPPDGAVTGTGTIA